MAQKIPRFLRALRPEEDEHESLIDNCGAERWACLSSGYGTGAGEYESAGEENGADLPRPFNDDLFLHHWDYIPFPYGTRETAAGEGVGHD